MKRHYILAAAAFAFAAPAFAETRNLAGFDAVNASGRLSVQIEQGPGFVVDITGPRAERVEALVRNGVLVLATPHNWFGFGQDANVRVTLPALRAIESSAGAEVVARDVQADALMLDASSGSSIDINGACRSLGVDSSSGAEVRALGLRCDNVAVDASSGADAAVFAQASADVEASSGADVRVAGPGRLGAVSLSSGGDLHHQ